MTDTARSASLDRKTSETEITLRISLDGDHMLTLFSRHGLVDLNVEAKGDIEVDYHHTVEDVGLALGAAFTKALGDKSGIRRYGSAYVPMDEALARVVVDCSGRPYLAYEVPRGVEAIGLFPFQLVEEFLRAFSVQAGLTLHVSILAGRDAHHMAEAIFKALGRALDVAVSRDDRVKGIPSTKGVL
jgi:imidazoleglycerol-phosphate dehydratase